ncbi:40S ribosomal protein S8 [Sesamum alatum]|uniref:40S ribosomal protein S8 n=1 Tax=Sesamum alatum TaxID=300844 RepID=A0AAE1Z2Z3_9LAMI|nr:40S ribosomal protein S8 [Sesamum alatum]
MGISRDSMHKRRATGGKKKSWRKKRKLSLVASPQTPKLDTLQKTVEDPCSRTQTLVKSAIVQVDAAPFKQWYLTHYGVDIGRKKKGAAKKDEADLVQEDCWLHSSRPGQCGRADGYILEGKELEFYMKKLQKKKGKAAGGA